MEIKMGFEKYKFWFVVGSQFLYGPETLGQVEENARVMVDHMNSTGILPAEVEYKITIKTEAEVANVVREANYDTSCAGIIVFCHTFSPSKMWTNGLRDLQKPYLHFHTQFPDNIPNEEIDMDYMNLHQSAHGDREHAHMAARVGLSRKIVVGYWKEEATLTKIAKWMRASLGVSFSKNLKVIRFGDNMREVGVTEGDKVSAQLNLGWQVNTWPVGHLVESINQVTDDEITAQLDEYKERYTINTDNLDSITYQARVQMAMEKMLTEQDADAFTNTFENLYGLQQLPGLATQDLMRKGYGFGAEGDWKSAAMTAIIKFMGQGMDGGSTFVEDYTYDLKHGLALGAHMLEVCPTVADGDVNIEVHPLGIGGKEDPARLVFAGREGKATLTSLVEVGGRQRLVVHEINCVDPPLTMPNLPTARVMWKAEPSLGVGAHCWMLAGGAHHSTLSYDIDAEVLRDFARIMNIEFVHIDANTTVENLEKDLFYSDIAWRLKGV